MRWRQTYPKDLPFEESENWADTNGREKLTVKKVMIPTAILSFWLLPVENGRLCRVTGRRW
jgi:hypothetical protein